MRRFSFLFFLLAASISYSQDRDLSQLSFISPLEQAAFENYDSSASSVLDLLLYSSPGMDSASAASFMGRLDTQLLRIQQHKNFKKGNEQKIKVILATLHEEFLRKYELESNFPALCREGIFNCVTASGLFAYSLERLGIPYRVVEAPHHVYLIAFPDAGGINIETTAPEKGYMQFDENFQKSFVQMLAGSKLISREELLARSTADLFKEYYYRDKDPRSFFSLAGMQYYNQALYAQNKNLYAEAFSAIRKALYLENRLSYLAVFNMTGCQYLLESDYRNPAEDIKVLGAIVNFPQQELFKRTLREEFLRFTAIVLGQRGDIEGYRKAGEWYFTFITDSALKDDAKGVYHYELAAVHYNKRRFEQARPHALRAYQHRPNNTDAEELFFSSLLESLKHNNNSEAILAELEQLKHEPLLDTSARFNSVLALANYGRAAELFSSRRIREAEVFRVKAESLITPAGLNYIVPDFISEFYTLACYSYFEKGQGAKAVEALKKGLSYVPGDYSMKRRLQEIN